MDDGDCLTTAPKCEECGQKAIPDCYCKPCGRTLCMSCDYRHRGHKEAWHVVLFTLLVAAALVTIMIAAALG